MPLVRRRPPNTDNASRCSSSTEIPAEARATVTIAFAISLSGTWSNGRSTPSGVRRKPVHSSGSRSRGQTTGSARSFRRRRGRWRRMASLRDSRTRSRPKPLATRVASRSTWIGPSAVTTSVIAEATSEAAW